MSVNGCRNLFGESLDKVQGQEISTMTISEPDKIIPVGGWKSSRGPVTPDAELDSCQMGISLTNLLLVGVC